MSKIPFLSGRRKDSTSADDSSNSRKFNWRVFLLLSLGIVFASICIHIYKIGTDAVSPPPPIPDRIEQQTALPTQDIEAIRQEAWQRIQPRLREADDKTRELTNKLVHRIEVFFDERKEGAQAFAEAALGWRSKWELIKSREGHREFIAQRFAEYIFTQDDLAIFLDNSAKEYAQGLGSVKNELLVKVRADFEDVPANALPAFANEQVLATRFDEVITAVILNISSDLQADIGRELSSIVIGEVIAAVVTKTLTATATRLGISAAIMGTGAASSWATVGAGIAIGIAVDYLLDWVIDWFYNPEDDLAAKVTASLDDVKQCIATGDPGAWAVYKKLVEMGKNEPEQAIRVNAVAAVAKIEQNGALGLKYALGKVADVRGRTFELTLRQLVYGDGQ